MPSENSKYNDIIALLGCTAMFLGFFCARALISTGSIILLINACLPWNRANTIQQIKSQYFLIICLVYWLCCALSLAWSSNMVVGSKEMITKLSLIAIPIGMTTLHFKNMRRFIIWITCLNVILLPFIINSSLIYFQNMQGYHESYMLYTTKYNDHIRFSLCVTLLLIINTFIIVTQKNKFPNRLLWYCLIIWSIYGAYFLHILSARTGLACLYIFIISYIFYTIWQRRKWLAVLSVFGTLLLAYLAIQNVPRLHHKVAYMQYELRQWYEGEEAVQYTLSDNNRILSYNVALKSMASHPLLGVGVGDVQDEMVRIYGQKYPDIPKEGALKLPHNQFLTTAMAIGLPGSIILILLLLTPLKSKFDYRYFLSINMIVFAVAFMIDAMLEVQFGLFLFLFFIMIWLRLKDLLLIKTIHKTDYDLHKT